MCTIKPVIIDKGIFKVGFPDPITGEKKKEPCWESNIDGGSLAIGHEDEKFAIVSHADNMKFIIEQLNKRLGLDFKAKLVDAYLDADNIYYECTRCQKKICLPDGPQVVKFCWNCGAVIEWEDNTKS